MAEAKRLKLRQLLGERLGIRDEKVLDKLYKDLEIEYGEDVGYALQEPDTGLEDLLRDIEEKRWLEYYQLRVRRAPVRKEFVEIELDEREARHAEALRHYLVRRAATLPEVRQFRDERLGGNVLASEQAEEFLRAEELEGVSEEELSEDSSYASSYAVHLDGLSREELKSLAIPPRKGGPLSEATAVYEERIGYIWLREEERQIDLGELGLWLASAYPWEPEDAAWFVLTGEPPEVKSLNLSYHPAREIFTLAFAPWISEETLRRAYRKARDRAHGGGDNRQPGEKALALLRFVSERTPWGETPKWTPLMTAWNEDDDTPPKWRFSGVSQSRKTYLRAERRVAGPRSVGDR